jgi:hypothetical protein
LGLTPVTPSINLSIKYNPVPPLTPVNTLTKPFKSKLDNVPSFVLFIASATNK